MSANKNQQYQSLRLYCLLTSLSKASTCGNLWLCTIYIYMGKLVHGLRKWSAKFRTSEFRPGITFTIFVQINSVHRKKGTKTWNVLVSKMALKKWNTNLRLEHSVRKNRTAFLDVPLLLEIFN